MDKKTIAIIRELDDVLEKLREHVSRACFSSEKMNEIRAALVNLSKKIRIIARMDRIGAFKIRQKIDLPRYTPPSSLVEGLAYIVDIDNPMFVSIGKVRITQIIHRTGETIVRFEAIKPYYVSKGGSISLYHDRPMERMYFVQVPAGRRSMTRIQAGIFKK